MTITRVIVRQADDRRSDKRRQGERRTELQLLPVSSERRHNVDFRVASRRHGNERRCAPV